MWEQKSKQRRHRLFLPGDRAVEQAVTERRWGGTVRDIPECPPAPGEMFLSQLHVGGGMQWYPLPRGC